MACFTHEDDVSAVQGDGLVYKNLITTDNGAVNKFLLGITEYIAEEYQTTGIHEIQEGFYVVEGEGTAKIGEEEFPIRPGSSFIAAKGVPHSIKKSPGSVPVKLVWVHGAV
jgi:mannose-6-phosphate isomerase-like protein (cupin superfamily)